jgi:exportin-2 (importin alpha re-exporter)
MEAQLIGVLRATLDANTATVKAATEQLRAAGRAPGFASCLVKIMGEQGGVGEAHVKQSAAVAFKNFVKNGWAPEAKENNVEAADHAPVGDADKQLIRAHLVQLMCSARPSVMAQLAEALRIISTYDFPDNWRELLPDLVARLAQAMQNNNWAVYNGVLETANSIFKRFRYVGKSDALFTQLLYIFKIFCAPMLQHFSYLVTQLPQLVNAPAPPGGGKPPYASCLEALRTLSRIFFSLNWQVRRAREKSLC